MKDKIKIFVVIVISLIAFLSIHSFSSKKVSFYPEKVKIALRNVGNKLLLKNGDSTSLVLPVKEVSKQVFELSFQKDVAINPEILVSIIDNELRNAELPDEYITELINCNTNEVSYSYEIFGPLIENEIPCLGRNLPKSCYTIKVIMLKDQNSSLYSAMGSTYTISLGLLLIVLVTGTTFLKKKTRKDNIDQTSNHILLGNLIFYPNEQKLSNNTGETSLTAKESELLAIFAQYPNKIVKREQLIKQVWEDNGVIVGRSLDMFISKLRKKLGKDSEVKITNVHGVGYKLEIISSN
ncbi:winged helix-turn-helix domain-containing protein [uncultured Aquimarina sp.]|uniref:winged helix-turn-helix domain-containing protein n=1 Tax=uncultured Aquimarina sp. TaxID=575652 RepID=UPI0026238C34|nr:winged helix-turn-helix domain-containing protein [uncultured Aquimarina sp.]